MMLLAQHQIKQWPLELVEVHTPDFQQLHNFIDDTFFAIAKNGVTYVHSRLEKGSSGELHDW